MKTFILTLSILLLSISSNAQSTQATPVRHFAQAMMENLNAQDAAALVLDLKNNPNVYIVRYDELTNGLLVITNELSNFNQTVFNSWLTSYVNNIQCYRQGLQGLESHIGFNSDFCNNL